MIKEDNPINRNEIYFNAGANSFLVRATTGNGISFGSNNINDRMYLDVSGSLGIGIVAPDAKIHVVGEAIITSTIWHDAAKTIGDFVGTGTPEGVIVASPGSTFRNTAGGANTSFYVKESGAGTTGWSPK